MIRIIAAAVCLLTACCQTETTKQSEPAANTIMRYAEPASEVDTQGPQSPLKPSSGPAGDAATSTLKAIDQAKTEVERRAYILDSQSDRELR